VPFLKTALATLLLAVGGCVATPLPHPPTADPDLMHLEDHEEGGVVLSGDDGSIDPGGQALRVTVVPGPSSTARLRPLDTTADAAGRFSVLFAAERTDFFFIEAILEDEDLFLIAVTGGPDGGVRPIVGLSDRDEDGSPDDIDCAPDDPTRSGQRC
jgi:hypothetical protein